MNRIVIGDRCLVHEPYSLADGKKLQGVESMGFTANVEPSNPPIAAGEYTEVEFEAACSKSKSGAVSFRPVRILKGTFMGAPGIAAALKDGKR